MGYTAAPGRDAFWVLPLPLLPIDPCILSCFEDYLLEGGMVVMIAMDGGRERERSCLNPTSASECDHAIVKKEEY